MDETALAYPTTSATPDAKQPQGNFIGFAANRRYKREGDNKPDFTGRLAVPGAEKEFEFALWAGQDKRGRVTFTGSSATTSRDDTVHDQIRAMAGIGSEARRLEENGLELRPGQMVLFANGFKDAENPMRPDFYGRWNPGQGQRLVSISAWARNSDKGQPLLTGQTQYALPKDVAMRVDGPADGLDVDHATAEMREGSDKPVGRKARGGR